MSLSKISPCDHLPDASLGKRVFGIDLATTRCCVAQSPALWKDLSTGRNVRPSDVETFSGWPAAYEGCRTNPKTALYYESLDKLPITGNDLDPIVNTIRRVGEAGFDTNRFFRLWKLMFHGNQGDNSIEAIQSDIQRKLDLCGKTIDDLLRDWVAVIYANLFQKDANGQFKIRNPRNSNGNQIVDLEVVVAVPPGRSVIAHEQVLQAFIQGPIRAHQVSLVSEPEALFRAWVADGLDAHYWKVGQKYLVCDGGGGTCCFVRFRLDRLDPLGFTQEFESESIICGAETISNAFEELAATMVPLHVSNRSWVLDTLRRDFDHIFKKTFGGVGCEERKYPFRKPWDYNSEIEFSYEQIAALFEDCVRKLVDGIRQQLEHGQSGQVLSSAQCFGSVNWLVLGGGLFSNPYVMKRIREEFPYLSIRELSADFDSKSYVAKGLVLTRLYAQNDFITSRPILRSKAVVTWMKVTPEIRRLPFFDLLSTKIDEHNGKLYFYAAQWLVKMGDEADLKHADDFCEVSSESSAETARTRGFDLETESLKFSETIVTVKYHPGEATWAAILKDDSRKLIDQSGILIPGYEGEEKVTWDPQSSGLPIDSLEVVRRSRKTPPYRKLRYSIQIQLREVGTKYRIKAYFLDEQRKKFMNVLFDAVLQQHKALFQSQEVSSNLLQSRKLGSGIRFEADPSRELKILTESRQFNNTKLPPEASHRAYHNRTQARPEQNSPSPDPFAEPQIPLLVQYPEELALEALAVISSSHKCPVNSRKRAASTECTLELQRLLSPSPVNTQDSRPLIAESSGDSSLRTPRRNLGNVHVYSGSGDPLALFSSGCWTCAFRNVKCEQEKPCCAQCSKVGIVCEYDEPAWFNDDELQAQQREINKRLIKQHKARLSSARRLSSKPTNPRAKLTPKSITLATQKPESAKMVSISQNDPQQSGSLRSPTRAPRTRRGTTMLDKLWEEDVSSRTSNSLNLHDRIYRRRQPTRKYEEND